MKLSPLAAVVTTCRVQDLPRSPVVQTSIVWPAFVVSSTAYRLAALSDGSADVNFPPADPSAPVMTCRSHVMPSFLVVSNTRQALAHVTAGLRDALYVGDVGSTVYAS